MSQRWCGKKERRGETEDGSEMRSSGKERAAVVERKEVNGSGI
jgi:hypothetical protein